MTTTTDPLWCLLGELRQLVPPVDVPAVDELARRLGKQALRVLVVGEAKRGKSTLLNALLGQPALPAGVVPLTSVSTTVRYGESAAATVRLAGADPVDLPLDRLADFVTETANPGNRKGVAEAAVRLPVPLLAAGVELVDTPGVGSVHGHNTTAALEALTGMDVAIFVLTADPPVSASELDYLRRVRGRSVRVFCVLNKVDRLSPAERAAALDFTRQTVATELGGDPAVFAVSARTALAGHDPGFAAFRAAFTDYLSAAAPADLRRSVAGHAGRLAASVAAAHEASLAALTLSAGELERSVAQFRVALDAVAQQRRETAALSEAAFAELIAATDAEAADLLGKEEGPLIAHLDAYLTTTSSRPAEAETAALEIAAERIRAAVDAWRDRRRRELDAAIAELDERLSARLSEHIRSVRAAAAELFRVDLPPLPPPATLSSGLGFSYAFDPDPGQFEALAGIVRRRLLPGGLARRQVARHVTDRAAQLLDKQIGRARADFQAQLTDSGRSLARELQRRFDDGAGRIAEAISAAVGLRAARQPDLAAAKAAARSTAELAGALAGRAQELGNPAGARDGSGNHAIQLH